jgi:hypothetical protein
LPDAVFEFPVGSFKNIEKVIDIGPGIMSAFMPALRALLQGLVVTLFVLFVPVSYSLPRANFKEAIPGSV